MTPFMDRDFLLQTDTAKHLFHDIAEPLPLVDYHCHIPPREIYEDRRFHDIVELWLGGRQPDGSYFGDHYKWRVMRSNGVSEDYITGDKPPKERLMKFAEALQKAIGNPMYHWCHLELRKFFGYEGVFCPDTVDEVWELTRDKLLHDPGMTARGLIRKANVAMIGTTDDPIDSLEWHEKLAQDPTISAKVYPSFRPDKAVNIHKPGFREYIAQLAHSVGKDTLSSVDDVCAALTQRLEFFVAHGCRACDHGLDYVPFRPVSRAQADAAFQKAMAGQTVTVEEAEGYQTALLLHLGRAYHRLGVVMQVHYNCKRNPNTRMLALLGPDTGYDCMNSVNCADALYGLLDALEQTGELPRTILYSLDPTEDAVLDTMLGAFQSDEVPGKLQHGSAWWFNDNKLGMENQMKSLANLSLLGNFVGMLTDSRSFLSYARHDYFRRILCNLIGHWVEDGEYPNDPRALRAIVEGVSYYNAKRYFDLT